jgi:predicted regulator of amino acid metabolism with ACT domain
MSETMLRIALAVQKDAEANGNDLEAAVNRAARALGIEPAAVAHCLKATQDYLRS